MSEQDFREIFGKNLSYFLELNQISRADLARMLDVHDSTVHSWIIGEKNQCIYNNTLHNQTNFFCATCYIYNFLVVFIIWVL